MNQTNKHLFDEASRKMEKSLQNCRLSTIMMLIIIPIYTAIFIFPFPESTENWFELFHNSVGFNSSESTLYNLIIFL